MSKKISFKLKNQTGFQTKRIIKSHEDRKQFSLNHVQKRTKTMKIFLLSIYYNLNYLKIDPFFLDSFNAAFANNDSKCFMQIAKNLIYKKAPYPLNSWHVESIILNK